MKALANKIIQYQYYDSEHWETGQTQVPIEAAVALTVNGEPWLEFSCTPADLEAMAVGFLFNEGLIQSAEEIVAAQVCKTGDNVDVWLSHSVDKPGHWRRTSGCAGGMTSNPDVAPQPKLDRVTLEPDQVAKLMSQLFEAQNLYREARGVHTSALSDGQRILALAEDIGRHNTLDKISGHCLLEGIAPAGRILLTTGRISSEMLQKAARMGVSVVISRTAPTLLSIDLAQRWGITLIGYARRNSFSVYAHPERIVHHKGINLALAA